MKQTLTARFGLGQIVRHRDNAFRGVVVDVDPRYAGLPGDTDPGQEAQPFYQVFAIGPDGGFIAYAAEAVLEHDPEVMALSQFEQARWFTTDAHGRHAPKSQQLH